MCQQHLYLQKFPRWGHSIHTWHIPASLAPRCSHIPHRPLNIPSTHHLWMALPMRHQLLLLQSLIYCCLLTITPTLPLLCSWMCPIIDTTLKRNPVSYHLSFIFSFTYFSLRVQGFQVYQRATEAHENLFQDHKKNTTFGECNFSSFYTMHAQTLSVDWTASHPDACIWSGIICRDQLCFSVLVKAVFHQQYGRQFWRPECPWTVWGGSQWIYLASVGTQLSPV